MDRCYYKFSCLQVLVLAVVGAGLLPNFCCGQVANQYSLKKFQLDLHRRVIRDQSTRKAIIEFKKTKKFRSKTKDKKDNEAIQKRYVRLLKKASDVDQANLTWIKKQIQEHGFPSSEDLGAKSADGFFLLILHADRDREFQKQCLASMRQTDSDWSKLQSGLLEFRSSQRPPRRIKLPEASAKKDKGSDKASADGDDEGSADGEIKGPAEEGENKSQQGTIEPVGDE